MNHSPEPWPISLTDLDWERLVICLEACKGISNERLESVGKGESLVVLGLTPELVKGLTEAENCAIVVLTPKRNVADDGAITDPNVAEQFDRQLRGRHSPEKLDELAEKIRRT